jgi:hypothetical protein
MDLMLGVGCCSDALFVSLAHNDFLFNLSSATSSIRQLLSESIGGGARVAACLWHVLVSIVVVAALMRSLWL